MMIASEENTLPWVEKYRPKNLESVLSQDDIIKTLIRFTDKKQLPHLLLHGPPGTGKTSTVQAIARKLFGSDFQRMVLELNASDDRGISTVRNTIKTFAETSAHLSSYASQELDAMEDIQPKILKLIVLDEADQMTGAAQMALRRIIENYAQYVRFVIICNYVNKINPALQSRCTKLRFPPLKHNEIVARTKEIAAAENVNISDSGIDMLVRISFGDMRKVLNFLQSAHMSNLGQRIDDTIICKSTGVPTMTEVDSMFKVLLNESMLNAFNYLKQFIEVKGYALTDIFTSLYEKLVSLDLPIEVVCMSLPCLADIEYRLSHGSDVTMQLGAIVSVFIKIRQKLVNLLSN